MKSALFSLSVALVALILSAPVVHAEPLRIVATVPTLAAIVHEVGGSHVDVTALASPRQDPHFVDARPDFVLRLNRAQLVVLQGLQLEQGWLPALLLQARNPALQPGAAGHFDAAQVIAPLNVPRTADRSQGDIHPGGNPHYLCDPRQGALVATALAVKLGQLDPSHAALFSANAHALAARLNSFAAAQTARFAQLPPERRAVVAYHDSWPYLLRWLALRQVATLEPKPGIPPDPAHVAAVVKLAKTNGSKALLQEEFYPHATARTVAQLAQAKLVIAAGGVRFDGGQRYDGWLQALADELYGALQP
jgi:zinc/manganese transport system substrate-binding protein